MPVWKVGNYNVGDKYIIADTLVGAVTKFNRLEEESYDEWWANEAENEMSAEEYKALVEEEPEFTGYATRAEWFCDDGDFA